MRERKKEERSKMKKFIRKFAHFEAVIYTISNSSEVKAVSICSQQLLSFAKFICVGSAERNLFHWLFQKINGFHA